MFKSYAILSAMVNENTSNQTDAKENKGLLTVRYLWRELESAKNEEQVFSILARVAEAAGGKTVHVQLELPPEQYIRMMGNAWFAKYYKEIDEMSMRAYLDRAMAIMELNLKSLAARRRSG